MSRKLLAGLSAGLGLSSLVFLTLIVETYRARLSLERSFASEQVNRLLQRYGLEWPARPRRAVNEGKLSRQEASGL